MIEQSIFERENEIVLAVIRDAASRERDLGIYKGSMDAATDAKAKSIEKYIGPLSDNAKIVDAGAGTGKVAELIASDLRGARVYTLDVSHELMECASDNRALTIPVYGDAAVQNFEANSIDVKYYSTSGHEIESFGTDGRKMKEAVANTFTELKPGGKLIIRDFAKPEIEGPVYMQIQTTDGLSNIEEATTDGYLDYSLLSKKSLFLRFHQEFRGGNAFKYEIVNIGGQEFIKLDAEWAHEFYLRKDYTANWRQEILEKYTYWKPTEAEEVLKEAGYTNIHTVPDQNEYILNNRLLGKIGLYTMADSGTLEQIEFPPTHMVVIGTKPEDSQITTPGIFNDAAEKAVDYQKLLETVKFNQDSQSITIDDQVFYVDGAHQPIIGKKKAVYRLLGEPARVLKTVRPNPLNAPAVFKGMYQAVARKNLLDEYRIPHLQIFDPDPKGPPYRYFTQEAIPQNACSAADLIVNNKLTETDIAQMTGYINTFELNRKWQLDTNPFNWYRVPQKDGTTKMIYVDSKVYPYDEAWEFRRIGLLQWLRPQYVNGNINYSAQIPTANEFEALRKQWDNLNTEQITWWKKYLSPVLQPQ